jgi:uncharacterized protein YndB with AHSA1/START domain
MSSLPDSQVSFARRFDASPAEMWRAWTEPEQVRQWFGSDPAGTVLRARLEVRVGGSFEVTFANSDGTQYTCGGDYTVVEPPTLLAFTWRWRNEPDVETQIRLRFEPAEDGTVQHFEHRGLGAATSHNYAVGWQSTFDKHAPVNSTSAVNLGRWQTPGSARPRGRRLGASRTRTGQTD